ALMIGSGEAEIVIAGGSENMSQIPYILKDARWGARMGDKTMMDMMIRDGLSDIFNDYHM
ncbi:MAG TPA: acetyl-CoA C-acyltransferase, partial [Candidatus Cloacimonas sp.]|nr:acetyl-CoA C-acyltransferase [Candidatus Cloacimonas sp.]